MRIPSGVLIVPIAGLVLAACSDRRSGGGAPPTSVLGFVGYETRNEVPAGVNNAIDLEVGDWNGDGIPDAAVGDLDGIVQVLLGQGGGVLSPADRVPVQGIVIAVRCGDLDGDLDPDLAVVTTGPDRATVLENDGAGDFTIVAQIDVPFLPDDVLMGDCTGDDRADLVVTHLSENDVLIYPGDGAGSFGTPQSLGMPAPAFSGGLSAGDVNGDGSPDVVVCDLDNRRIFIFPGNGDGTHGPGIEVLVGRSPFSSSIGDLTGDGLPDIAVSNLRDQTISVIEHLGGNAFQVERSIFMGVRPAQLTVADLDRDGSQDIAVCGVSTSTVSVFYGGVGGVGSEEVQMGVTGSPFRPIPADIDQDGRLDLVVASVGVDVFNVYRGRGDRGLAGSRFQQTGGDRSDVVIEGAFGANGEQHLAVSGGGRSTVSFFAPGPIGSENDPSIAAVATFDLQLPIVNITAVDVDQDGRDDVVCSVEDGIKILANTSLGGGLSFRPVPPDLEDVLAPGAGPIEVAAGDLDGDGLVDLAVAQRDADRVTILFGSAAGDFAFEDPLDLVVTGAPFGATFGDYDGDGLPELAVSRENVSTVSVIDVVDGTPEVALDMPVGPRPNSLRTADFNRDGRDDLVVSNADGNSIGLLISGGAGFTPLTIAAGERPTALLTEDLNRDGNADILVASFVGTDFRIILGDGQGGFAESIILPGAFSARTATLMDLNSDSLPELLIGSTTNPRLAVFKNVSRE